MKLEDLQKNFKDLSSKDQREFVSIYRKKRTKDLSVTIVPVPKTTRSKKKKVALSKEQIDILGKLGISAGDLKRRK